MKRILKLLFTALLLSAALCVSASASDFDAAAKELSAIGMFRGTASGFELDRAPTRSEAAIMLVRLYGAEETAKADYDAGKISHPFTDVSEFTSPYVAWLYSSGITNGFSETTFGSQRSCTAQNYVTFLLRALGYQDEKDFQYAQALDFAREKGFYSPDLFSGTFLRDDLAALTYQALATDTANGKTYLLESLMKSGAIDAAAAQAMAEKIEAYRALQTACSKTSSLAADITTKLDVTTTANGQTATVSSGASGDLKLISGSDGTLQLAYQLVTCADDMGSTTNLWLKDGWQYQAVTADGETVCTKAPADDRTAVLDSLPSFNLSNLALVDSISRQTVDGVTVYTLLLNQSTAVSSAALKELLGDAVPERITAVYTVSGGSLKKFSFSLSASMDQKSLVNGFSVSTQSVCDYSMTMTVTSTGRQVSIDWPDLSGFAGVGYTEAESAALTLEKDSMTYQKRLEWAKGGGDTEIVNGLKTVVSDVLVGENCFAYVDRLLGTPPSSLYKLSLCWKTGSKTAALPLPDIHYYRGTAAPDTMFFSGDKLIYSVTFDQAEIVDGKVIHQAGTYRYEVDLNAKTVSLLILDP